MHAGCRFGIISVGVGRSVSRPVGLPAALTSVYRHQGFSPLRRFLLHRFLAATASTGGVALASAATSVQCDGKRRVVGLPLGWARRPSGTGARVDQHAGADRLSWVFSLGLGWALFPESPLYRLRLKCRQVRDGYGNVGDIDARVPSVSTGYRMAQGCGVVIGYRRLLLRR